MGRLFEPRENKSYLAVSKKAETIFDSGYWINVVNEGIQSWMNAYLENQSFNNTDCFAVGIGGKQSWESKECTTHRNSICEKGKNQFLYPD